MMNPDFMLKLFTGVLALCWLMQPVIVRLYFRPGWRPRDDSRRRRFERDR